MKIVSLLVFTLISLTCFSQYPSKEQLIKDVKAKGGNKFETVTPVGEWGMFHDKVPKNKQPDACAHDVDLIGPKKADGSYWMYKGKAIYSKAGNKFEFDRIFISENETRLNGVNIPDNDYFLNLLVEKIDQRDDIFVKMNRKLYNATSIYKMEMTEKPTISGNSESLFAEYLVNFVIDHPNGSAVNKIEFPLKVKAVKKDNVYVIMSARNVHDGKIIESKKFGSPQEVNKLTKFIDSNKKLKEFMK